MKSIPIIFLLLFSQSLLAQIVFTVDNFSPDYIGKINVEDTNKTLMKGWIAIYDKKSGKELIKVKSDELFFKHPGGKVEDAIRIAIPSDSEIKALAKIGIIQLHPFPKFQESINAEESIIMYDDYNFDGVKDFAIEDGQESEGHTPSFSIYLATKSGFKYSKEFSRLAHENKGMFTTDSNSKEIFTSWSKGCCLFRNGLYIVESNRPKPKELIERDASRNPYEIWNSKVWNENKVTISTAKQLYLNDDKYILVFNIVEQKTSKEKKVILFEYNNLLNYAFLDTNELVEFSYPIETDEETPGFTLDTTDNNLSLSFGNRSATYRVYELPNKIGIEATIGGILYEQIGILTSKKGSLKDLLKVKVENLVLR